MSKTKHSRKKKWQDNAPTQHDEVAIVSHEVQATVASDRGSDPSPGDEAPASKSNYRPGLHQNHGKDQGPKEERSQ